MWFPQLLPAACRVRSKVACHIVTVNVCSIVLLPQLQQVLASQLSVTAHVCATVASCCCAVLCYAVLCLISDSDYGGSDDGGSSDPELVATDELSDMQEDDEGLGDYE